MNRIVLALLLAMASALTFAKQESKMSDAERRVFEATDARLADQMDYWFDKGDFPRCIQILKVRYEMRPASESLLTDLGWMLENIEHWDEALSYYVRFRHENPDNPDAPYSEANFYFRRKLYAKVLPLLEPTLEKKPHPNSFRILAHAYDKLGQLKDSLRVWDALLTLTPDDGQAKVNRAKVAAKLK